MSANNRATLISRLHTVLKKQYKVPPAQPTRPLLEHVLYGCLLENAPAELADEGMAKCEQEFFDWNEVRVTTITELAQVLARLPEPNKAAQRLKSNLQAIFEEFYTFDLDHLKKENLGKATSKFEKMPGMTPFVLSYTIQHGLGGHSIPVDYSAMVIMLCTGIASQAEASAGKVPGLERAIPKSKGIEFSSLLHQAGIALNRSPKDKKGRAVLDAVVKGSSKQLDEWLDNKQAAKKRVVKRKAKERAQAAAAAKAAAAAAAAAPAKKKAGKKTGAAKQAAAVTPPAADKSTSASSKKTAPAKKKSAAKAAKTAKKKTATKKPAKKKTAAKPASSTRSKTAAKKKTPSRSSSTKTPSSKSKRATGRRLTKRKPR